MTHGKKTQSKGFALTQLVIVILILGIIGAIAVPRFIDLQSEALAGAKAGITGSVKSAFAIATVENKTMPTVTQLAANVQGEGVTAIATGIQVDIDGINYTVPTYTDKTCSATTTAVNDTVSCVGAIL